MKLSFFRPSRPSSTQQTTLKTSNAFNTEEQDQSKPTIKEYVTEFVASINPADAQKSKNLAIPPPPNVYSPHKKMKNLVAEAQKSKNLSIPSPPNEYSPHKKMTKLVIPPLPNEFRPHKKIKNLDLPFRPSDRPDLRFEVEKSSSVADGGRHISYGLNLRNSSASIPNTDAKKFESDQSPPQQWAAAVETVLLQKLKEDLNRLNDCGVDDYDGMPVEEFGAALLAGYGWHEGRGIGRDTKGDVKVISYKRRTGKRGIGCSCEMLSNIMFSEKKEKEQTSSSRGEDKELGLGFYVDEVMARIGHVGDLGLIEEERCLRKLKESKDEMGSDGWSKQSHTGSKRERIGDQRNRVAKQSRKTESRTTTQLPWLTSHIRVRIISKELKGGRLYLKKGEVVDMVGQSRCDISMDGSREVIQGADQHILETVIPHCGGAVLVLYGKHKGTYGHLLERDMDNEICIVRDADTHELLKVRLEQIAEYIGDPSYIGY